jgi:hypothetical protein
MKRRRFLSSMGLMLPASILSTELLFSSCKSDVKEEALFAENDIRLLDEIGETILPASVSSPGAKAAKVGEFMKVYVTDCYTARDQETFSEGIITIKKLCQSKYGDEFINLTISQKYELLNTLEKEAAEQARHKSESVAAEGDAVQTGKSQEDKSKFKGSDRHYYSMIKDLTLLGYFTSEPGATKALRYIQTPGYYKGEVLYKQGDKAWAT